MTEHAISRCDPGALRLLADFWVLRIIDELAVEPLRYAGLQRALDASPATLSNRLHRLEEEGMVRRLEGTAARTSVVYALTARGTQALPVIRAIDAFAVEG